MKGTDKFLIAIVAGVIALVIVAFAIAWLRPRPTYRSETTAEGVAFNYLFALQEQDYARAYGYLSPTISGYPASLEAFTKDVNDQSWAFQPTSATLDVGKAHISGSQVTVTVQKTVFYGGSFLSSHESSFFFNMVLVQAAGTGTWKIVSANSYWLGCWNNKNGC